MMGLTMVVHMRRERTVGGRGLLARISTRLAVPLLDLAWMRPPSWLYLPSQGILGGGLHDLETLHASPNVTGRAAAAGASRRAAGGTSEEELLCDERRGRGACAIRG